MRKVLPLILAIIGLGAGMAAGWFLRPPSLPAENQVAGESSTEIGDQSPTGVEDGHDVAVDAHGGNSPSIGGHDYVKLNNQFIVPVLENGRVSALVILSLSLEVTQGSTEVVYTLEPKLRDALLRVMFDHANAGGFAGNFTNSNNMVILRDALREAATKILGSAVSDVLIIDMVRQDA